MRRLLREVGQLGHARLHAVGHLVLRDARGDLRVAEFARAAAGSASARSSSIARRPSRLDAVGVRRGRAPGRPAERNLHALVLRRQEAAAPQPVVERLVGRVAGALRDQHDERGQVLVLAAEAVAEPGADARPAGELGAGLEEGDRRVVVDRLGVHRLDEAELVGDLAVCGSSSLTQAPLLPCCANLNLRRRDGEASPGVAVMPVSRWPLRIESGRSFANQVLQAGLWSNRSICDGAPDWNR